MAITYGKSFKTGSQVVKCTPAMLNAALDSPAVAEVCGKFKTTWLSYQEGEISEELYKELIKQYKENLKPTLPFITPHACEYKGGHRKSENATPSGLAMLDIDGTDPDEMWELVKDRIKELGIVMVHRTPSYRGFRIIYKLKEGQTISQSQSWMAGELGTAYDTSTKDLARTSLLVPRSYVYFLNQTELFKDRTVTWDVVSNGQGTRVKGQETTEPLNFSTSEPLNLRTSDPLNQYPSLPYPDLVDELIEQLGGLNGEGGRNNMVYLLACNLRHVCNHDPHWLASVMPEMGLDDKEVLDTCISACNKPAGGPPEKLKKAMMICKERGIVDDEDAVDTPPVLPKKLPAVIKHLTSKVPDTHKPAVAMAVFAPLGAHLRGVEFEYISGERHEATFMCLLVAPTSDGKNLMEGPLSACFKDINERDSVNQKILDEWQEENSYKSVTKDKKKRPKVVIQQASTNTTPAAFLCKLKGADGHFLYSNMKELKELNRLKNNPSSKSDTTHFEILLQAYDRGEFSADRVSADAVSGKAKVRWNWNASCTPKEARAYFQGQHSGGVTNRLNLLTLPDQGFGAKMPKQGVYDDKFYETLKPYIKRLCEAEGLVECKKAKKNAEKLVEDCQYQDLIRLDLAYHNFFKRACVLAYLRGMVLYIAGGYKWDKTIEEFVRWSLDYDMWCKLHFWGEAFRQEEKGAYNSQRKRTGQPNALEEMPDTFTRQDVADLKVRLKLGSQLTTLISKWKDRGIIEEVGEKMRGKDIHKQQYKKTQKYLDSVRGQQGQ